MLTVPIVDLTAPTAGADLVEALEHASSALLVNHGIDISLRREVIARTREFFALPFEQKAAVRWPGTGLWFGWQPVYSGSPEYTSSRAPDLVERFEMNTPETFTSWPAEPAGFAEAWTGYHDACAALSTRLMTLLVDALDLPRSELATWTGEQYANLVANHYLPQVEAPLPGQTRVAAHTDRGGITLLAADEAPGGLEVRLAERTWVPVVIPEDAYVIQVGDLFSRWTNKRIPANVHRVVNPPREVAATASRMALVYFHYPRLDALVSPAPSCVGADGPRYEPVIAADHVRLRQDTYRDLGDEQYALLSS